MAFFNKCIVVYDREILILHILQMKSKFTLCCFNYYWFCSSVSENLFISAYIIFVPGGNMLLLAFGQQLIYIHTWYAGQSGVWQFYIIEIMLFKSPDYSRAPQNAYSATPWVTHSFT